MSGIIHSRKADYARRAVGRLADLWWKYEESSKISKMPGESEEEQRAAGGLRRRLMGPMTYFLSIPEVCN
jgi:hypothetical protein